MFNDTPAQNINWLLGVRQMVSSNQICHCGTSRFQNSIKLGRGGERVEGAVKPLRALLESTGIITRFRYLSRLMVYLSPGGEARSNSVIERSPIVR